MSIEDLMKPRYKVIADYPNSCYRVGVIIDKYIRPVTADFYDKFPHLFQKLEWYEERSVDDMPEYVKRTSNGKVFHIAVGTKDLLDVYGKVHLVSYEEMSAERNSFLSLHNCIPATIEEYNTQQKTINK